MAEEVFIKVRYRRLILLRALSIVVRIGRLRKLISKKKYIYTHKNPVHNTPISSHILKYGTFKENTTEKNVRNQFLILVFAKSYLYLYLA